MKYLTLALFLFLMPSAAHARQSWWEKDWAVTAVTGRLTVEDSSEIFFEGKVNFADASVVGLEVSKVLARTGRHIAWEAHLQAVKHFGAQDHWEATGAISTRWLTFPWNDTVRTSFALGAGVSHAFEVPALEEARHERATKTLNYLLGEIALGPPSRPNIDLLIRYQHRSGVLGIYDGVREASSVFGLGIKYRF